MSIGGHSLLILDIDQAPPHPAFLLHSVRDRRSWHHSARWRVGFAPEGAADLDEGQETDLLPILIVLVRRKLEDPVWEPVQEHMSGNIGQYALTNNFFFGN